MMASGVAHSGMVAKLGACRLAFASGVTDISIVAGRDAIDFTSAPGTRIVARLRSVSFGEGVEMQGVEAKR
jgi:acetylglutamate kinase